MKIIRSFLFFIILASLASCSRNAPQAGSVAEAASSVNNQAKTTLGVDIQSLAFLFEAKPGTFLLKDSLVDDGSWTNLKALESAGYVKLTSHPDAAGEVINIQLTDSGTQVLDALSRP
jgi:hypothetical protein